MAYESTATSPDAVIDVTEAAFEAEVIDRSYDVPVLVDFWAPWCGPCRALSPVLERLASEADGRWVLAKLNTDENPGISAGFRITSIPTVIAFVEGEPVNAFMGALPEAQIRAFIDSVIPSEADRLAEGAMASEASDDLAAAEAGYRAALALEAEHPRALLGLGRILFNTRRTHEAIGFLDRVPQGTPEREKAESWAAKARFQAESGVSGGETEARRRVADNPDDMDARLELTAALTAREQYREALEGLLEVMKLDRDAYHDRAHERMLAIFKALGDEHDLTREYRPQLAALLW